MSPDIFFMVLIWSSSSGLKLPFGLALPSKGRNFYGKEKNTDAKFMESMIPLAISMLISYVDGDLC